jgi:hypothetical protein
MKKVIKVYEGESYHADRLREGVSTHRYFIPIFGEHEDRTRETMCYVEVNIDGDHKSYSPASVAAFIRKGMAL